MSSTPGAVGPGVGTGQVVMLVAGTVISLATIAAWLYGATHGIDTAPLFAFVIPVVGSLFIANGLGKTAEHAQAAATQTNGMMGPRIKAAVSEALAERDAARTRQAQGDISDDVPPPAPTATAMAEAESVLT
jgi:hypothetical protein